MPEIELVITSVNCVFLTCLMAQIKSITESFAFTLISQILPVVQFIFFCLSFELGNLLSELYQHVKTCQILPPYSIFLSFPQYPLCDTMYEIFSIKPFNNFLTITEDVSTSSGSLFLVSVKSLSNLCLALQPSWYFRFVWLFHIPFLFLFLVMRCLPPYLMTPVSSFDPCLLIFKP